MAAVLACGRGAALSHRSAAVLWRLPVREGRAVDVVAAGPRAQTAGMRVHRSRSLAPSEVTVMKGIPVTTLPRTLADLADVLTERELSRAVHEAEVLHRISQRALDRAAESARGRRGCGRLRRTVGGERDVTRSALERRFLSLCRRHGLPRPEVNVEIAGLECDFAWREQRLAVETDGWAYHHTRRAFERDRERDQLLTRAGFQPLRFTYRQVVEDAEGVAATIRAALA
jgi:very-short-patch-repair endonuclease